MGNLTYTRQLAITNIGDAARGENLDERYHCFAGFLVAGNDG